MHSKLLLLLASVPSLLATPSPVKRDAGFPSGQPIDGKGKGAPIFGKYKYSIFYKYTYV